MFNLRDRMLHDMQLHGYADRTQKAYLTVVYCCGLRLQEALHLQIGDIDGQRKLIHFHLGKGAKDRYVPLPDSTLEVLRDYWKSHRNQKWVFPRLGRSGKEGPTATEPMNKETVHGALRRVLKSLPAITKPVRVHTSGQRAAIRMPRISWKQGSTSGWSSTTSATLR